MPLLKKTISLVFLLFITINTFAQSAHINIPNIVGNIVIDANLSEPQWQKATKILVNNVTRPYENEPSPVNTEAYIMEDGETFYVAFVATDPNPDAIRAYLKDRDSAWGNDLVGVKIDTYNDHRLAYQFWVNPLGVQNDSIENEMTKSESSSWDGLWTSYGRITDTGFIVEMALPLRMLNFNEALPIQTWGLEFVRFYPREQNLRISNISIDRNNNCMICQMQEGKGFKGAEQGDNITVVPSLVIGKSQQRDVSSNEEWQDNQSTEASLDVRWGITPDILFNATLNPDFSTVEADSAQLSINNNFALYNQEKRPFFLDNADYFTSDFNLIYTRNINAPEYGAKLTGRLNSHSFGMFVANDQDTNILIPGNINSSVASLEGKSKDAALRYRYDMNDDLSIGWISTFRQGEDYDNIVNGLDSKYRISTTDVFQFQYLFSATNYPEQLSIDLSSTDECNVDSPFFNCQSNELVLRTNSDDTLTDNAFNLSFNHDDRDWEYTVRYQDIGKDFRADLGFMSNIDRNQFVIGGTRKWYGDQGQFWHKIRLSSDWDITHNSNNEVLEKEFEVWLTVEAELQSTFRLGYISRDNTGKRHDRNSLAIKGNTSQFSPTEYRIFFESRPVADFYYHLLVAYGDSIDYANDRLGTKREIRPQVTWNIGAHAEFNLRHTYQDLEADNNNVFIARLTDLKFTYQFDINSYVRFNLVYNNTNRNPENYLYSDVNKKYQSLNTQLLYAYKVNAQTVLYAGYSDSSYADDDIIDLQQNERNVFLKVSYAWLK